MGTVFLWQDILLPQKNTDIKLKICIKNLEMLAFFAFYNVQFDLCFYNKLFSTEFITRNYETYNLLLLFTNVIHFH